jgi:hypothetical protein
MGPAWRGRSPRAPHWHGGKPARHPLPIASDQPRPGGSGERPLMALLGPELGNLCPPTCSWHGVLGDPSVRRPGLFHFAILASAVLPLQYRPRSSPRAGPCVGPFFLAARALAASLETVQACMVGAVPDITPVENWASHPWGLFFGRLSWRPRHQRETFALVPAGRAVAALGTR